MDSTAKMSALKAIMDYADDEDGEALKTKKGSMLPDAGTLKQDGLGENLDKKVDNLGESGREEPEGDGGFGSTSGDMRLSQSPRIGDPGSQEPTEGDEDDDKKKKGGGMLGGIMSMIGGE